MLSSLASLKRHQKCMRTATKAIAAAAMKKSKVKTKAKRAQVKAAASQLARLACSVSIAPRMRRSKKGKRKSSRSTRSTFNPPDFSRNLLTSTPSYEPPFNPEVF